MNGKVVANAANVNALQYWTLNTLTQTQRFGYRKRNCNFFFLFRKRKRKRKWQQSHLICTGQYKLINKKPLFGKAEPQPSINNKNIKNSRDLGSLSGERVEKYITVKYVIKILRYV